MTILEITRVRAEIADMETKIEELEEEILSNGTEGLFNKYYGINQGPDQDEISEEEKQQELMDDIELRRRCTAYEHYKYFLSDIVLKLLKNLKKHNIYVAPKEHMLGKFNQFVEDLKSDIDIDAQYYQAIQHVRRAFRILLARIVVLVFNIKFPFGCDINVNQEAGERAGTELLRYVFENFMMTYPYDDVMMSIYQAHRAMIRNILSCDY